MHLLPNHPTTQQPHTYIIQSIIIKTSFSQYLVRVQYVLACFSRISYKCAVCENFKMLESIVSVCSYIHALGNKRITLIILYKSGTIRMRMRTRLQRSARVVRSLAYTWSVLLNFFFGCIIKPFIFTGCNCKDYISSKVDENATVTMVLNVIFTFI